MKSKYFNQEKNINISEIEKIGKEISNGKIVIFPTETVYGIGANALDENACESIFQIKGRSENKPLIVLISDLDMLEDVVENISKVEKVLIEKFWPGPLTIIFEKSSKCKIPEIVTASQSNIGIRMTSSKIARMLIQKSGVPIVAPSANLSGNPTGIKIENIIQELGDKVDYIIDCGDIQDSTTSTVVQVKDNVIHILREGKIVKEELSKIAEVKII